MSQALQGYASFGNNKPLTHLCSDCSSFCTRVSLQPFSGPLVFSETFSCIRFFLKPRCCVGATSGYNGGPGSVGGSAYGVQGYDPYGHTQHAYGASSAMQPQAPSSPYGRSGGVAYGGAGGFGSAMGAPANPYATAAAPVPARSPVRLHDTPPSGGHVALSIMLSASWMCSNNTKV